MRMWHLMILAVLFGCASGAITGLLRFQDREYLIHPDKPYLSFPYHETVCVQRTGIGRILGKKCTSEQRFKNIDMNKKEDRKRMIDGAFSCKSKARFKY